MKKEKFKQKYGPWALIAGGSQGIGEAFARVLAMKGINLVLVARRKTLLEKLSVEIEKTYGIEVRIISADLAESSTIKIIEDQTKDIEISTLVYNAAIVPIGRFLDSNIEEHQKVININCRGPAILVDYFGKLMKKREKGGIILVSSMAGFQGTPLTVHYAASKAYNIVLAEGLWYELRKHNIDVLVCTAGNTSTPNYIATEPDSLGIFVPKAMVPMKVAKESIAKLGKRPSFAPGLMNKFATFLVRRILSRKQAINFIGRSTHNMYGKKL
ncbi:MAG: Pyridoxal 4-dehydrogenase [Candidatus Heimdallarchaeota archaeon AB_125]|nr:MAG: Pyridoxal 4-dehydrogenase [Candidatus Heimdallarchaeota archaeon AB_125]